MSNLKNSPSDWFALVLLQLHWKRTRLRKNY